MTTIEINSFAFEIPQITSLRFTKTAIILYLKDGRTLTAPLSRFPAIQQLTPQQRRKYNISGGIALDFDDAQEVYHISDFLGRTNTNGL
jgi:hypothetical protein